MGQGRLIRGKGEDGSGLVGLTDWLVCAGRRGGRSEKVSQRVGSGRCDQLELRS